MSRSDRLAALGELPVGDRARNDRAWRYRRPQARSGTTERRAAHLRVRVEGRSFCRGELLRRAVRQARVGDREGMRLCHRAGSSPSIPPPERRPARHCSVSPVQRALVGVHGR